ncbi:trypsin-like serine protease [Vibrio aestuarianus]|uniref:Trypsin-like serine protease n=1 Tax=Vibrio aestuarianus TaxID=28171 RepID=A0A9X4FGT3_9VIBR|nr:MULTISPECIES: trypsin-like serine protease [Vibrio]MDE1312503.1 trypsin-like serine protease [Vibrio aestuarianus]MDE1332315.1 trypsin-like serine protease [Vibrio aestuarianus]MDE1357928.1 trypsin-like serine protease [Vibrio aestuarianus]MDF9400322.1 trypsin-like serine protease [Vibrio sp. 1180_3]NGZ18116.1 trypsin-like serine protease [Vibrio aestuarianus]
MHKRILLVLLFSASVSAVDIQPYIVNGTDTTSATYPSFASLFYQTTTQYSTRSFCGASIINDQFILTAAHCIYNEPDTMLYTVVVPQLDDAADFPYGNIQQSRASAFYYLDSYVGTEETLWQDDIAIIKLETPLNVTDYSSLLNVQLNDSYPLNGVYRTIGHGLIAGNVFGSTRLQETTLDFVDHATCAAYYGSALTSTHICFDGALNGSYKNSTCSGDSGGPVYWFNGFQYIQIGLTSFGPAICGDSSQPVTSVFTELYDYQSWINRVITNVELPKYYVETRNGVRTLVEQAKPSIAPQQDSGGSVSWLVVLLVIVRYRTKLWRMVLH